jgi:hypothetical protein
VRVWQEADDPPADSDKRADADGFKAFQPGVAIDWVGKRVRVDSQVVLREGPLEFFACFHGREHESILRMEASGAHIYAALGLIGLQPGSPPSWDMDHERFTPASGDLIDVSVEWEADGEHKTAMAHDWIEGAMFDRPALRRPWVFTGSIVGPDKSLACDRSGAGIAVVDFGDSLLSLSISHTDQNAYLWATALTEAIPPRGAKVALILSPARPADLQLSMDHLGMLQVAGQPTTAEDVADLIDIGLRLDQSRVQTIRTDHTLRADIEHVRSVFRSAKIPDAAVRFVTAD